MKYLLLISITLSILLIACDEIPQHIVNDTITVEKEDPTVTLYAAIEGAEPSDGETISANASIVVRFDHNPGEVTVSAGTVKGNGKSRVINGPFNIGVLALTIEWENGGGSYTLNYTVVAADVTPPEVTGSNPANEEKDVDTVEVFANGIEVTFNEPVTGRLVLLEDGSDVGWISESDADTITLIGFAGQELSNETEYEISGTVSDRAGNKTEVSITFITNPGPPVIVTAVDHLVAHWQFDSGFGDTVLDSSGNARDGQIAGNPKWTVSKFGKALEFDGENDYVVIVDDATFGIEESITVTAWFYPIDPVTNRSLIIKNESFSIGFNNNNELIFAVQPNDTFVKSVSPSQVGNWRHFAVTYDGKSMKVYINGELESEEPNDVPISSSEADLLIGHGFSGIIDEVLIYNKALIDDEIQEILWGNF